MENEELIKKELINIAKKSNCECDIYTFNDIDVVIFHSSSRDQWVYLSLAMKFADDKNASGWDMKKIFSKKMYNLYYAKAIATRKEFEKLGFTVKKAQKDKYWTGLDEEYHIKTSDLISALRKEKTIKLLEEVN